MYDELINQIETLKRRIETIEASGAPRWVHLTTKLTSTSWDGDARSTTAKTLIDLSAVFSVPAGVRAVAVEVGLRDSGSAANDCYMILDATNTDGVGHYVRCGGLPNDYYNNEALIVPCNTDGDIYYQIVASGASTMDVFLYIWGYYL